MDMNMTDSGNSSSSTMTMMYFHTGLGVDTLWFAPWVPASVGSTFGACVGLLFLSIFYRWLFALRAVADLNWKRFYPSAEIQKRAEIGARHVLTFHPKADISRGVLEGLIAFVGYFLMLVVMTMNTWYFISIIIGITVGETFFGQYTVGLSPYASH